MNIIVIGIGKLGLCFSLTLEKKGYMVVGIDINEDYVDQVNSKTLSSEEPFVREYLRKSKKFVSTTNIKMGLEHSDIIFLFVSTPSLANGRYDHSQIERVVEQLAQYSSGKHPKHLIIGCTTMPGYCDTVQERLNPHGYTVSYNPEFIAQGSVMEDLANPDILLIGEGSKKVGDEIEKIYLSILQNQPTIHRMTRKEAEITKIALNCFLTTKIAYANMVGDIAKSSGCNPDVILKAVGSDSRIGNKYLKYGFGYGGPCFPRDNRAFSLFADDVNINAIISKASDTANKLHMASQVTDFEKKYDKNEQIIFSDVSYKVGTNIIEESQKLALAVKLAELGYNITIRDKRSVVNQVKKVYNNMFTYVESK